MIPSIFAPSCVIALGLAAAAPALAQCDTAKCGAIGIAPLTPSSLGESVAIDGTWAMAGAGADSEILYLAGAVYVYRFDGSDWSFETKIRPADATPNDRFGSAVALSGERAVIGAWNARAAYVFEFKDDSWVERAKLQPPARGGGDRFGDSVAIDDDLIVVGAYLDGENGNGAGAAYVYRFDGKQWLQEAKLLETKTPAPGDHFGYDVDVRGDIIVVSVDGDDDAGQDAGAVDIFRFDSSGWVNEFRLQPPDLSPGDAFGVSVAIDADTIGVGAPGNDDAAPHGGAVYVYQFNGKAWVQDTKLLGTDTGAGFGAALDLNGGSMLGGTSGHDGPCGIRSGGAYLFAHDGSAWGQQAKLLPLGGAAEDRFGYSVATDGETYLVGAIGAHAQADPPELGSGAVSFFHGKDCAAAGYCAPAVGLLFNEQQAWTDAVGESVFIGFGGFPAGTWITDQYAEQGVIFQGGGQFVWPDHEVMDGWTLIGKEEIDVQFSTPHRWIAVEYFGMLRIQLFREGQPVFTTNTIVAVYVPDFAGILLAGTFDRAVLTRPDGDARIDNLYFGTSKPGDVNFDGMVDVQDLVAVILDWGLCVGPPPIICLADHDGSGTVDAADLFVVINHWGP